MIKSFADIDRSIKENKLGALKTVSVAAADEDHVLHAVCEARGQGLIDVILTGNKKRIEAVAEEAGLDLAGVRIVGCESPAEAAQAAVGLIRNGEAHILMKGLLDTAVYMKAVLDKEKGLRDKRLLSHVTVFEIPGFDRLFYLTDSGLNLEPSLEDKEIIMKNAVSLANAMGNDLPKVAFVCPVEKVNPRMDSTLHAQALKEKYKDNKNFYVDGPFGLDNAISEEAAAIKDLSGPVAGKADVLIVNDIGVGNVMYKTLTYFAHAKNAGLVIGAKAPVLLYSRADSIETKLNCIKLGIMLSDYYLSL